MLDVAGEIKSDSRETGGRLRSAYLPRGGGGRFGGRHARLLVIEFDAPDFGQVGGLDVGLGAEAAAKSHFHVRLAGTNPEVTDDHIFEGQAVVPLNG